MHRRTGRGLHEGFLRSVELFPRRPAVEVDGECLTFEELYARSSSLAATLMHRSGAVGAPLVAVFAHRSITAFVGVLGALLAGRGYVPLNRTFPTSRTRAMLHRSGTEALVVDQESVGQLDEVLTGIDRKLLIVLPDHKDAGSISVRWPQHDVVAASDLIPAERWEPTREGFEEAAYLLFTSGSTGTPKGVMVTHQNVTHFVDTAVERYEITEEDRFSQTFDFTFDLSVFDMFVAWQRGACVCCPTGKSLTVPSEFIADARLTVWFSVPSVAVILKRLGLLKPNRQPQLRWSLFCGEALTVEVAEAWAAAAPKSTVENLYGPTEATIACTVYRWDPHRSPSECELGVVPIGAPLAGMTALVVDPELRPVVDGNEGELLMAGPQVTPGYWQDPEKTSASFVVPPGEQRVFYRTGDRVRRNRPDGPLLYRGRMDGQVQVHGHRVELGEVEAALRLSSGVDAAIALGWPRTPGGVAGVVGFLGDTTVDVEAVRRDLVTRLPRYMVPHQLKLLPSLPVNANGKFDRGALLRLLEEEG